MAPTSVKLGIYQVFKAAGDKKKKTHLASKRLILLLLFRGLLFSFSLERLLIQTAHFQLRFTNRINISCKQKSLLLFFFSSVIKISFYHVLNSSAKTSKGSLKHVNNYKRKLNYLKKKKKLSSFHTTMLVC